MSNHSSPSPARTPGIVLGGVVILGVTAVLSLPFPLLGGLLLTPALLGAAITGYLNRPSSRIIALTASSAALIIALLSIVLAFFQPSGVRVALSTLHTFYGLFCTAGAFTGTAMLWLGRRRTSAADDSARAGTGPASAAHGARPDVREDLTRVGSAAARGTQRAAMAWETYQRLSEPRRQRAVARAERRERRRADEREQRRRLEADKRGRESDEIHKAQLRQARAYNSNFWF